MKLLCTATAWGQEDSLEEGNPLQCSCPENSMDRGVRGVAKSQTQLSD